MRKGNRKDLSGEKYGRLTVIREAGYRDYVYFWECACECGTVKVVNGSELKRGKVKSCGCLQKENKPPVMVRHGMARSKLYRVWVAMRQRCNNPNDQNFARYGGRGIKVAAEWDDFETFATWARNNGYVEGLVDLDREDNDKGYSPENCRFISHKDNLKNTHRKVHTVIDGVDMPLSDVAEKYGLPYNRIYMRYKSGKRGGALVARE